MYVLLLCSTACFGLALLLPAFDESGFFRLSLRGWKLALASVALLPVGAIAAARGELQKALFCLLPTALNFGVVALLVMGFTGRRGQTPNAVGAMVLGGSAILWLILLWRVRDGLKSGSYCWGVAAVMAGTHGMLA